MPKKINKKKILQLELEKLWKEKCYELYSDKCLICGNRGLYHHYIMKSRNGLLKYEIKNAICLCPSHHYKIHNAPPTEVTRITEQIRKKKGKEWCAWVDNVEHTYGTSFRTIKWLEKERDKLKNNGNNN